MEHGKWIELAEVYASGALDGSELLEFKAHLDRGCSICEEQIQLAEETLTLLPKSLSLVPAPAYAKQSLMNRLERESRVGVSAPIFNWAASLVAACLVVALGANLYVTRRQVTQFQDMANSLAAPETRTVPLAAMEASPGANGKMFWNPKTCKGLLVATGLQQLPQGMVYELWAISGNETIPAGTFTVDAHGCAHVNMAPVPADKTIDKFAVTLEPAGGVTAPTGTMHLLGAV